MTVLKSRRGQDCAQGTPQADFLKGSVLQVTAMSLPFVLVQAFDPLRGRAKLTIDVRIHQFGTVNDEFADAVIRCSSENETPGPASP